MKQNYLKVSLLFLSSLPYCSYAQSGTGDVQLSNKGLFSIRSETVVSTLFDFNNSKDGSVLNDGIVYYYQNFRNDGDYSFTSNSNRSKAVFSRYQNDVGAQLIEGQSTSLFYNIDFDNSTPNKAFDLKNNIDIYGSADFKNGIVKVDDSVDPSTQLSKGMISFMSKSNHINARDASYVDGLVEKVGAEGFTYPVGAENFYRTALISAPSKLADVFTGQYFLNDASFFTTRNAVADGILTLDKKEYWMLDKSSSTQSSVILTLSWDDRTTPTELLVNPESELHIVRWDDKKKLWVDEGGVVDMSTRTVSTPLVIGDVGAFTLAKVVQSGPGHNDVVVYNLVSSNGDGKNDYFIIENIRKYPNNKVEIFNRWGDKVYETTNYDPAGDGSTNVFDGHSEGKGTIGKKNMLPSGTYYYILTYEYTDASGSRMIKKAANLHLDTN